MSDEKSGVDERSGREWSSEKTARCVFFVILAVMVFLAVFSAFVDGDARGGAIVVIVMLGFPLGFIVGDMFPSEPDDDREDLRILMREPREGSGSEARAKTAESRRAAESENRSGGDARRRG